MIGKCVGAEVETPIGGKLMVREIYFVDEERYQQILAEAANADVPTGAPAAKDLDADAQVEAEEEAHEETQEQA